MFWSTESTFNYPFHSVVLAIFSKYPNPFASHVISSDVIEREVDGDLLKTTRIFTKTGKLPSWVTWISLSKAYILEVSSVNLKTLEMEIITRNLSHSKMMLVRERQFIKGKTLTTEDSTSTDNLNTTFVKINVSIVSNTSFAPIRSRIEGWGLDRFRKNTVKVSVDLT